MTAVVTLISDCIVELNAAGYGQTAEILAIARLDLLATLHGVSDEELEALIKTRSAIGTISAGEKGVNSPTTGRKKPLRPKPVQNKSR